MKRFLTSALLVFFCTALSVADDSNSRKIDRNNDGKISKEEYIGAVTNTFNKIDKNNDGFLTKEELKIIDEVDVEKFFKEGDINKDGRYSKEEFIKTAKERFNLLTKTVTGLDQK
jgi:hypothetical protein